jgi:hypothetical protein
MAQVVFDGTNYRLQDNQRLIGRNILVQRNTAQGGRLSGFTSLVGGSGYVSVPGVTFTGGGGTGAAATAVLVGSVVVDIVITNVGKGYTSAPTVGFTGGGGGSGASATAVVTNTGALKLTKANTGNSRVAHIHPVVPGERVSLRTLVYRPSSGGMTGNLFAELRYVKVQGVDANGRPLIVFQDNTSATGTLSATTDAWTTYTQEAWSNGASGAVRAPAWATHAMIVFNLDSGSAGDVYLDDIVVSRWA